jgi:hypothetical protein
MENLKQYLQIGIMVIIVIGFLSFFYYQIFYVPKVEVGDVWRITLGNSDNPYENVKSYDYKVIDVKDGYVKSLDLRDSTIYIKEQEDFKRSYYKLVSRGEVAIIIYLPHNK